MSPAVSLAILASLVTQANLVNPASPASLVTPASLARQIPDCGEVEAMEAMVGVQLKGAALVHGPKTLGCIAWKHAYTTLK